MKRKNFSRDSEEELDVKEDIHDKTINIYDRTIKEEPDIHDKTVGIMEIKEHIERHQEPVLEEPQEVEEKRIEESIEETEDPYDKTVGIFASSNKPEKENDEDIHEKTVGIFPNKKEEEEIDDDVHEKTVGIFSNFQQEKEIIEKNRVEEKVQEEQEEKKELVESESIQGLDVIKQIELTREELLKDNELLVDIGNEEQLSIEIPKNIKDSKKIVLKGLGNKNTKTGKKGDLIIQVTIREDDSSKEENWDKNQVNYDYILFVGKNESLKDTQKIMVVEKNQKIIVPLDESLQDFEIFDCKYKGENKKVLLVKTKTKQEAETLNKTHHQVKIGLKKEEKNQENYKIVKYKSKEIPIKIPKTEKTNFLLLGKEEDLDSFFKIEVTEQKSNKVVLSIGLYIGILVLAILGYFVLQMIGLGIGLALGLLIRDKIIKIMD